MVIPYGADAQRGAQKSPGTQKMHQGPATDTWTEKADMPTPRYGLCARAAGGKIYAIGGVDDVPEIVAVVEEYNPATDTWTQKANTPTPRRFMSSAVVNGKIYAVGGFGAANTALDTLSSGERIVRLRSSG